MTKMYTTSKTNPITGDPVNNSSFPGSTGSKREARKNAAGKLTRKQNKALNQGLEKKGRGPRQYYKGVPVEETAKNKTATTKDWRDRSKIGAILHGTPIPRKDKGGKKGPVVREGKGGRANYNKMDAACKKPK